MKDTVLDSDSEYDLRREILVHSVLSDSVLRSPDDLATTFELRKKD